MLEEVSDLDGLAAFEFARAGQSLLGEIASFSIPVAAAIRGFCLGGGLDLALSCHARVAAYNSSFGCPGASLGLITGWAGTQRLPALIGKPGAMQMFLTGERVQATQALSLGLANELVPSADLIAAAVRRAQLMANHAARAQTLLGRLP